ncbi:hypothetical protein PVAND_015711 [Polypedilum vanderplanki]|uniref:Uncharacterized protein n=1 Tax=Polypedilum vanderplanki TaxID=319348 RepID=A0A9J6BDC4_POLVA|nr:hypothetical protein PVAND_015711 [Polypedilum vanderplanki]
MKNFCSLIFLIILALSQTKSEIIKCRYHMNSLWWESNGNYYECEVLNKKNFTDQWITINRTEGHHLRGKSNNDVQSIYIDNALKLHKFPKNIRHAFKHLILIRIVSSKINKLSSDDLKFFPKLKFLYIRSSHIENIEHDLLKHNPEIEVIDFVNNKIVHIDEKTFSDLKHLRALDLRFNECQNLGHSNSRTGVEKIIKQIKEGECQSDKFKESSGDFVMNFFRKVFYEHVLDIKVY